MIVAFPNHPATAASQTAKAAKCAFDWTNEDWALTWLPPVRMAVVCNVGTEAEMESFVREAAAEGLLPGVLDEWHKTAHHLLDLCDQIDRAINRIRAGSERLGV